MTKEGRSSNDEGRILTTSSLITFCAALIAWPLATFGGVYLWAGLPLILGCASLALACRPRILSSDTRFLDLSLVALAAAITLQALPLPGAVVAWLSPRESALSASLRLDAARDGTAGWRTLSIEPGATLYGLALLAAAVVLFWSCRHLFAERGSRRIALVIAWGGLLAALLGIVQQAVSRGVVYGGWEPIQAGAHPFGPFVNRNHFATWVVMAVPLMAGYLTAGKRSRGRPEDRTRRGRLARLLGASESRAFWLGLAAVLMTIALFASTSRSGILALVTALAAGAWLGRRRMARRDRAKAAVFGLVLLALIASYANVNALLARLDETVAGGARERSVIWKETAGVIRDFWMAGTGVGSYQTAMLVYQRTDRTYYINQAHNHYLHLAAEGGLLVALPAAVAALAFIALVRLRLAEETTGRYWVRLGAATGLLAAAVQSVWDTGLRMPANAVLCAVLAAIAVYRSPEGVTPAEGPSRVGGHGPPLQGLD